MTDTKPTVLQILPALDVGGVERGTLEIAKALVDRGYGSFVVSNGGRMLNQLEAEGSKHIKINVGKKSLLTIRHCSKLKNIIEENNVNIVHVRSRMPAWITYYALRSIEEKNRPDFISTVHGPYSVNFYSKIMLRGQKIIAISDFIKNHITNNYTDIDPEIITVIHRGIDKDKYNCHFTPDAEWTNKWQREVPGTQNNLVITLPARITRWKGQADFIDIIRKLLDSNIPVHGVIAGAPHPHKLGFYREIKNKIQSSNMENHISLIGQRDDMREIMKTSDIVMSLAKVPEAFGRTALEALSLGTPVVAYDHGGASEVLNTLFPEGLIPPNKTDAAVEKIHALYKTNPEINKINPFTLDSMITKTIKIYEESINKI
ncbi:MAG: glycosyltransferase family 4 protein [Proteobacteria bacterium]|nr:glycosyltransferase family 4 protein [Pseudomonadota bacterium]